MSDIIPLSVPCIRGNEWAYIKECLDTGWVSTSGQHVDMFEKKVCEYAGIDYAVATMNGTAALHLALKVVGVVPDDEVIVPTLTFIAPVNVVRYVGAYPIFMDCDRFYNIDVDKVIQFINEQTVFKTGHSYNRITDRRISAILPVHIFGNAVDLEKLIPVCRERNIKIVEDATESLGTFYIQGRYSGKYTGTVGDIGCYSFNGNKIITTGSGGMLVTGNADYADKAKYLSTQAKDDAIRYIHNEIGYNFRLSNIQAAMGLAQLEQLPEYIKIKRENYQKYKTGIDNIPGLHLAETPAYAESNYWFYALQIDKDAYGKGREELMGHLANNDIQTRPLWHLNHQQMPFANCQSYRISNAIELLANTLNIPCSVSLSDHEIKSVSKALKKG